MVRIVNESKALSESKDLDILEEISREIKSVETPEKSISAEDFGLFVEGVVQIKDSLDDLFVSLLELANQKYDEESDRDALSKLQEIRLNIRNHY